MKLFYISIITVLAFSGCMTDSGLDRGHFVADNTQPLEVSFEFISDLIIIQAEINGVSGKFLFDNGFSLSAVNEDFGMRANIDFSGGVSVQDANNKRSSVLEATVDSVVISGQTFVRTGFYQMDTDKFFPCDPIDGVIGASIINKANWKIDFDSMTMQISSLPFLGEGSAMNVSFSRNNSSLLNIKVQGVPIKCKIDLGSTSEIKVNWKDVKGAFIGVPAEKRIGIMSLSAHGLGNVDTTYLTSERQDVRYSGTSLPRGGRVLLERDLKYQGYIGVNYFKDYGLIINSLERQYILTPTNRPLSQEVDSSYGLAIYHLEEEWRIIQLNPNDPMLSDIALMDKVTMIDSLPMSSFKSICDYKDYIKGRADSKKSIGIAVEGRNESLILPYRKRQTQNIPVYIK